MEGVMTGFHAFHRQQVTNPFQLDVDIFGENPCGRFQSLKVDGVYRGLGNAPCLQPDVNVMPTCSS